MDFTYVFATLYRTSYSLSKHQTLFLFLLFHLFFHIMLRAVRVYTVHCVLRTYICLNPCIYILYGTKRITCICTLFGNDFHDDDDDDDAYMFLYYSIVVIFCFFFFGGTIVTWLVCRKCVVSLKIFELKWLDVNAHAHFNYKEFIHITDNNTILCQ